MNAYSAFAVLKFDNSAPGRENEMPSVLSCNWLPDGEYPVYLQPTPPHDSEGPFVVENTGGEFVASFASKLLAEFFVMDGSGCYRHRDQPSDGTAKAGATPAPGSLARDEVLQLVRKGRATPYQRRIVSALLTCPDGLSVAELAEAISSTSSSVPVMVLCLRRLGVPIESTRLNEGRGQPAAGSRRQERYWLSLAPVIAEEAGTHG